MSKLIEELKKIQRLNHTTGGECGYQYSEMYECYDGDYVRWDDIADLIKKYEGETK